MSVHRVLHCELIFFLYYFFLYCYFFLTLELPFQINSISGLSYLKERLIG